MVLPCEGVNDLGELFFYQSYKILLRFPDLWLLFINFVVLDAEQMTWVEIYYKTQAFNSDYIELKLNPDDHRIKILQGTNLEIQNAQPEDAGTYSCFLSKRRYYDEFERLLLAALKLKILGKETQYSILLIIIAKLIADSRQGRRTKIRIRLV